MFSFILPSKALGCSWRKPLQAKPKPVFEKNVQELLRKCMQNKNDAKKSCDFLHRFVLVIFIIYLCQLVVAAYLNLMGNRLDVTCSGESHSCKERSEDFINEHCKEGDIANKHAC